MLSILIPVYNFNVDRLVLDLKGQCDVLSIDYEILLLNDGSDEQWNLHFKTLEKEPHVIVHYFEINKGRIAARKILFELAKYETCICLDCDAEVISENYIYIYLKHLERSHVVAGGHIYSDKVPEKTYMLHWKYGKNIEARDVNTRKINPYQSFSTFNFGMQKKLYLNFFKDLEVEGYGHEDTLMGHLLERNGIAIKHIDNSLKHIGLKTADAFIADQKVAVENAIRLSEKFEEIDLKLIKTIKRINQIGLTPLIRIMLKSINPLVLTNLKGPSPSIRALQLFKLKCGLYFKKS